MNLLKETIEFLKENSKSPSDVLFINIQKNDGSNISFSWEKFCDIASEQYYTGYGQQEVNGTINIVGDNWWLERYEYDGSEGWEFKTIPKIFKNGPVTNIDLIKLGLARQITSCELSFRNMILS